MTSHESRSRAGTRESSTARGSLGMSLSSGRTCRGEHRGGDGPADGDARGTLSLSECVQHISLTLLEVEYVTFF